VAERDVVGFAGFGAQLRVTGFLGANGRLRDRLDAGCRIVVAQEYARFVGQVVQALDRAVLRCGVGPGKKLPGGAQLEVTRDFGQSQLYTTSVPTIRKDETVMRLLESKRKVTTSYGGKFVDSIDGLKTRGSGGRSDWFYYVNGSEASPRATPNSTNSSVPYGSSLTRKRLMSRFNPRSVP